MIGIVSKNINNVLGVTLPYAKLVEREFPKDDILFLPMNTSLENFKQLYPLLKLVILVGGKDIDPQRYNEKKSWYTGLPDHDLEIFDKIILPDLVRQQIPLFGICRGFQTLNIHFGGKLDQNLTYHQTSRNRSDLAHEIFYDSAGRQYSQKVNSLHHQGVKPDQLAKELVRHAYYSKDTKNGKTVDLVESFYHAKLPIAAVQWHPEELDDCPVTRSLLKYIL